MVAKRKKKIMLLVRLAPLAQEIFESKTAKQKEFLEQCCHMLVLF